MLGVKTGRVPLGFKRSKRFLWFLFKILLINSTYRLKEVLS